MAVSANGDLFVVNNVSNKRNVGNNVLVYTPPYTGTPVTISNGISGADALAIDGAQNLLVANANSSTVTEYAFPYTGSTPALTISNGIDTPTALASRLRPVLERRPRHCHGGG
jgi:hypothetical protein